MSDHTIDTLKELMETRFEAIDVASELQRKELSRRLDILNHAHEQAVEVQNTYVPREVFDGYKETTSKALLLSQGRAEGVATTSDLLLKILPLVIAIAAIAVTILIATRPHAPVQQPTRTVTVQVSTLTP
jgi:hypothetical protein